MNWLDQIETELQRILPNENPGRTRTTARRIAGIALQQYRHQPAGDFLVLLNHAKADDGIPANVRSAIERLTARLDVQFKSPSVDPVNDAMIVVRFVKDQTL